MVPLKPGGASGLDAAFLRRAPAAALVPDQKGVSLGPKWCLQIGRNYSALYPKMVPLKPGGASGLNAAFLRRAPAAALVPGQKGVSLGSKWCLQIGRNYSALYPKWCL